MVAVVEEDYSLIDALRDLLDNGRPISERHFAPILRLALESPAVNGNPVLPGCWLDGPLDSARAGLARDGVAISVKRYKSVSVRGNNNVALDGDVTAAHQLSDLLGDPLVSLRWRRIHAWMVVTEPDLCRTWYLINVAGHD